MAMRTEMFMQGAANSEAEDAYLEPLETSYVTTEFVSGIRLHVMSDAVSFMGFTDVPGGKYQAEIERRVSSRFFMTRTAAHKLYRDLGKLLNAGN